MPKKVLEFTYQATDIKTFQYNTISANTRDIIAYNGIQKSPLFSVEKSHKQIGTLIVNFTSFTDAEDEFVVKNATIFIENKGTFSCIIPQLEINGGLLDIGTYNFQIISGTEQFLGFKGILHLVIYQNLVRTYTLYTKK